MDDNITKLIEVCKNMLYNDLVCSCDIGVEKETGDYPPETNDKNWYGDSVWRNEVCNTCQLRMILDKIL